MSELHKEAVEQSETVSYCAWGRKEDLYRIGGQSNYKSCLSRVNNMCTGNADYAWDTPAQLMG